MVFELSIKLQHNCFFSDYSEIFGNKMIYHYCSNYNDYLIVPGRLTEKQELFTHVLFDKFDNLRIKSIGDPSQYTYIMFDCPCAEMESNYITPTIRKHKGVPIFPQMYQNGWEYYKIYCKSETILNKIINELERLSNLEIININDLGDDLLISQTAVLNQLITDFTPKQLEVLLLAFEKGYYNIPRSVRTLDIAQELDKTRYGIDKTLRTAENKIIKYIMPFIYLYLSNINMKPIILAQNIWDKSMMWD